MAKNKDAATYGETDWAIKVFDGWILPTYQLNPSVTQTDK